MKRLMLTVALVLLVLLLLPFAGPQLGLTSYEHLIEPPGRTVTVTAGNINVREHPNDGRQVVLIHGHPGSAQMMRPLARSLQQQGYRVWRYDRLGWGHSSQRTAALPANPAAHARDLLELVIAEDIQDPLFVGYSYGGGVLMEANRAAPETFRHMVLLSSVGNPRKSSHTPSLTGRILNSALFQRWALGTDFTTAATRDAIASQVMFPEQPLSGEMEGFVASLSLPGIPTNWVREAEERYIDFPDYRPNEVVGCTMVLHGAQDQVVPVTTAHYLAGAIHGAKLRILPDAGHGMLMAQPDSLATHIINHDRRCRNS